MSHEINPEMFDLTPAAPTRTRVVALRRRLRVPVIAGVGAAFAVGAVGFAYAGTATEDATAAPDTAQTQVRDWTDQVRPEATYPRDDAAQVPQLTPPGAQGQTTATDATDATDAQEEGLVYINTVVDYGSGEGAGTGMVLTSNGTILTNHHVIEGATRIKVEIVSTGETFDADVVGYDDVSDVAVLQLQGASGLDTVDLDESGDVQVGDEVTAVGNANGDGAAASAAAGTVTALEQSITAQSDAGAEQLTGLIEIDADVVSGDSGGAVYDSDGEVIGLTTAASSGQADITGYAVPIEDAMTIVRQIESGQESGSVALGGSAFLGIQLSTQSSQPVVVGAVEDSPAATAGIDEGSTITAVGGTAVATADDVQSLIAGHTPGDRISVAWTDVQGQQHEQAVTLATGPVG